jgi:hypothetical protein
MTECCQYAEEQKLTYREEERDKLRHCRRTRDGLMPLGPPAAGALCRPVSQLAATDRGAGQ